MPLQECDHRAFPTFWPANVTGRPVGRRLFRRNNVEWLWASRSAVGRCGVEVSFGDSQPGDDQPAGPLEEQTGRDGGSGPENRCEYSRRVGIVSPDCSAFLAADGRDG